MESIEPGYHSRPRNWTDDLASGNDLVDQQHQKLLRRFEMLEDALKSGQAFAEVKALAAFLQRYVLTHFNTEERYMLAGHYPGSAIHSGEHDQCKRRIFQFKQFIETESDRKKIIAVAYSMLAIWVREHILNHDVQCFQYLKHRKKAEAAVDIDYEWSPKSSKLWTPDFEIGIENIDTQHRNLVMWTEYVQDAKSLSDEEIRQLLDFIHGFIVTHFTDEELLMMDIQFPDFEKHSELHYATRTKFFEVKEWVGQDLGAPDKRGMVLELFQAYVEHIEQYDTQFKKYFRS
ncbi:MAG TPA: hemerythrin domain-containing protein [bacterium]|nr:hemerythrin domain-containing protein [bacterium]